MLQKTHRVKERQWAVVRTSSAGAGLGFQTLWMPDKGLDTRENVQTPEPSSQRAPREMVDETEVPALSSGERGCPRYEGGGGVRWSSWRHDAFGDGYEPY